MTTPKLTTHEIEVLRGLCDPELMPKWGAWVGACLEHLSDSGLVTRTMPYEITEKGRITLSKEPEL